MPMLFQNVNITQFLILTTNQAIGMIFLVMYKGFVAILT